MSENDKQPEHKENVPVKKIEDAEAIAVKLTEFLGLEPTVEYKSNFKTVKKRFRRPKAERTKMEVKVWDWIYHVDSLQKYREIEKKLLTIAKTWKKTPLYDGRGITLDATVGKVSIDISIVFEQDKILPIMSQILQCEVVEVKQESPASTHVAYVCKTKTTQ